MRDFLVKDMTTIGRKWEALKTEDKCAKFYTDLKKENFAKLVSLVRDDILTLFQVLRNNWPMVFV